MNSIETIKKSNKKYLDVLVGDSWFHIFHNDKRPTDSPAIGINVHTPLAQMGMNRYEFSYLTRSVYNQIFNQSTNQKIRIKRLTFATA